jgi:hypothetical protein
LQLLSLLLPEAREFFAFAQARPRTGKCFAVMPFAPTFRRHVRDRSPWDIRPANVVKGIGILVVGKRSSPRDRSERNRV